MKKNWTTTLALTALSLSLHANQAASLKSTISLPQFQGTVTPVSPGSGYNSMIYPPSQTRLFLGVSSGKGNQGGITGATYSPFAQTDYGVSSLSNFNSLVNSFDGSKIACVQNYFGIINPGDIVDGVVYDMPPINPDPSSQGYAKNFGTQGDQFKIAYVRGASAPSNLCVLEIPQAFPNTGSFTLLAPGNTAIKSAVQISANVTSNVVANNTNTRMYALGDTNKLYIYDWNANKLDYKLVGAGLDVVSISDDATRLLLTGYSSGPGSLDGQIGFFDISNTNAGSPSFINAVTNISVGNSPPVFSADGQNVFFVGADGGLYVIDAINYTFSGGVSTPGLVLASIAPDPANSTNIYAYGTEGGVSRIAYYTLASPGPGPGPTPVPTSGFPGQPGEMQNYFDSLSALAKIPPEVQVIFTAVQTLPATAQETAYQELAPQFKIVQFAEEKLDLLLHKEMQDELYRSKDHKQTFVIGGYDNLNQDAKNGYVGYKVNTFYQMLGTCFEREGMNWLFGAGVSESYMNVNPTSSDANYVTAWGSFGFAKLCKNWYGGFDSLFGYSMLNTHRNVSFLNETADSSHGLWNISFDGTLGYRVKRGKFCMKTYDIFGYIYGQENEYTETGIPGNNFFVKNEEISQIRNQFGIKVSKDFQPSYSGFIDAAYVYEYYINNNAYQAALVGTDVFQTFNQTIPTKNYGRVHAGFEGTRKKFVWRLAYTGLYGSNFQESSVSLKLGAKY